MAFFKKNEDKPPEAESAVVIRDSGLTVDVEKTLKELKDFKKGNVPEVKTDKKKIFIKVIMWIFFPITALVLLYRYVTRKLNMPITVKMTIIYTLMFAIVLSGFAVFFIGSIKSQLPETAETIKYFKSLTLTTVILGVLVVVVFASLGAVSSQVMLKPVRSITEKIDDITGDNLSTRLDQVDSQDELRELTNRINEMLDNLEQSFNRQQNFVSDASHELKTPIAVIQGYANLLKRWGKSDQNILDEGIDAITRESDNMKRIVEQLLLLARLGAMTMNNTRFNLVEVIDEMVEGYRLVDKAHTINFVGGGNIEVETDKNLLLESVRTLVDNAIKYTDEGGSVTVGCQLLDDCAKIWVSDTGMGIDEVDLPHIFERFYRCDKVRGREKGSSGLGLAIAKSIVTAMHGDITVSSTVGVGTTFTIFLY